MNTIVVPLDGSQRSERALAYGAVLAEQAGADLVLMTSRVGGVLVDPKGYLHGCAAVVGHPESEVVVPPDTYPARSIADVAAAHPNAMVVMSTRGHGRLSGAVLGSVAEQVVRESDSPLVLIGPECTAPPAPLTQLLVAVDVTAPPFATLQELDTWARAFKASLRLVNVTNSAASRDDVERLRCDLGIMASRASVVSPVRTTVLRGDDPAEALSAAAALEPGVLLTLETHARTGIRRLQKGSVAADVVRRASTPVLVVRSSDIAPKARPEQPDQHVGR